MDHAELSRDPEVHQKKPLSLSNFQVWEQVDNNMFPIPPIIRFTCWSCWTPALLKEPAESVLHANTHTQIHTHNTHTTHHTHTHTTHTQHTTHHTTPQDKTRQDKREEKRRERWEERRERHIQIHLQMCFFSDKTRHSRVRPHPDLPWNRLPSPPPGNTNTIELLKQVKNWQSPSRDPWSNCPINSRETTKGQTNYSSGRQSIVQVCSLTIKSQVVQFLPSTSISEQFESIVVTILQQISFLPL